MIVPYTCSAGPLLIFPNNLHPQCFANRPAIIYGSSIISRFCFLRPCWTGYYHWLILWLVVSTPLKNTSQLGWLFPIYGNIKNVPNHQSETVKSPLFAATTSDHHVRIPGDQREKKRGKPSYALPPRGLLNWVLFKPTRPLVPSMTLKRSLVQSVGKSSLDDLQTFPPAGVGIPGMLLVGSKR